MCGRFAFCRWLEEYAMWCQKCSFFRFWELVRTWEPLTVNTTFILKCQVMSEVPRWLVFKYWKDSEDINNLTLQNMPVSIFIMFSWRHLRNQRWRKHDLTCSFLPVESYENSFEKCICPLPGGDNSRYHHTLGFFFRHWNFNLTFDNFIYVSVALYSICPSHPPLSPFTQWRLLSFQEVIPSYVVVFLIKKIFFYYFMCMGVFHACMWV